MIHNSKSKTWRFLALDYFFVFFFFNGLCFAAVGYPVQAPASGPSTGSTPQGTCFHIYVFFPVL
jgi:hypothetical protein